MDISSLDQFESVFKRSFKTDYHYQHISFAKILVICDSQEKRAYEITQEAKRFLRSITEDSTWVTVNGSEFDSIPELIELVQHHNPDFIITYRNLKQKVRDLAYSLGSYLVVLTQSVKPPVLVLPYFKDDRGYAESMADTNSVTVIANHIEGDDQLINFGVKFTEPEGTLHITHIENAAVFAHYLDAISKIPQIDTDLAKKEIAAQLLKQPRDYIDLCSEIILQKRKDITIKPIVAMGHTIKAYSQHVKDHKVDLLILHGKDESQLAMNGITYSLAVELKELPLLLI